MFDGGESVGEATRGAESPTLEAPVALALVEYELDTDAVPVRVEGEEVPADVVELAIVEGSARSRRLPEYRAVAGLGILGRTDSVRTQRFAWFNGEFESFQSTIVAVTRRGRTVSRLSLFGFPVRPARRIQGLNAG